MEALNRLVERGIAVSLCTGRGVAELKDYEKEFAEIPYGILNSGGCVYDFRAKKPLYRKLLDDDVVLECLKAAGKVSAMPYLLTTVIFSRPMLLWRRRKICGMSPFSTWASISPCTTGLPQWFPM